MTPSDLLTGRRWPIPSGSGVWRRHLRRIEKPARVAAQTAAAAGATFGLFTITGLPQTSWAVVSALFVIQPNVGGTVGAALGRIAGTALGTAVGLACVYAIGVSSWASAVGLVVATASLGFVTGFRPGPALRSGARRLHPARPGRRGHREGLARGRRDRHRRGHRHG